MPVGMHYHYTEGFFDLAILFEWLFRPQQMALSPACIGSFFRTHGSIHPQYSDWELSDLGHFNFYFECCFEDHDFLSVSSFFNMLDMFPIESIENQYGIDLKCYLDLVPPDIEKKLNELSKDINRAVNEKEKKDFDVFLTHSSLDKEEYVSELSEKLEIKGLKVFEDVKVFKLGHSQTDMMNKGILNSKFVVVFLSPNFIKSSWSDYEFKSFLNREINEKKLLFYQYGTTFNWKK